MNRWLLYFAFGSITAFVARGYAADPEFSVRTIPVGGSTIEILQHDFGNNGALLCNVHDDEDTSVDAAMQVLGVHQSGKLIQIRHTGKRLVEFRLDESEFTFDPNRIFTEVGIRNTLEKQSAWTKGAQQAVAQLSERLLDLYGIVDETGRRNVKVVIALHNNTEARYAASSYLPKQVYGDEAAELFIQPGSDPDDFFFVTDRRVFDALRSRELNVVLQNNDSVTDDGSLSVYCGKHGIPYVNVEAQHGHLQAQVDMISTLFEVLRELKIIAAATGATTATE